MNILLESRLSDDELIERTRKRLNTSWKFRVLLVTAGLVWGLMIVLWIIPVAFDWIEDGLKQSGAQWRWFYAGMSTGAGLGSLLFISAMMAFYLLFLGIFPTILERRDRLLVQYYDELHRKT